ncbi:hypothetical protein LT330_010221 [Penicillium expansum]|nr:hypothetical protein LT330_010221 [Penicillium expansum]
MPQLGSVTRSPPPTPPKSTLPARSRAMSTAVPPVEPADSLERDAALCPPIYRGHKSQFVNQLHDCWTTCPGSPNFEYEWDGVDSAGQKISQGYGLALGRPILEDDDASTMIFQSSDKLYIWDVLYHDVYEIASRDINEVARVLSQEECYKKLQKRLLDPVEDIAV